MSTYFLKKTKPKEKTNKNTETETSEPLNTLFSLLPHSHSLETLIPRTKDYPCTPSATTREKGKKKTEKKRKKKKKKQTNLHQKSVGLSDNHPL